MLATVIYTSLTGNTEEIAEIITDELEANGLEVDLLNIEEADGDEFMDSDICVVCSYTYDDGVVPEEIYDFYEELPSMNLEGKIYGVAGSGDTFYEDFCSAVDDFEAAFAKTGATKGATSVKVELAPETDDINNLEEFARSLVQKAK